ncbi:MAG TPA: hypothetical protein VHI71_03505 [Actinomycetota bacterium]|nr:hypothetical protein [Actinomycetota bacterium]
MPDQIKLQHGATPWTPTRDAEVLETFVHYDFPRVGIVRQGDESYVFACLDEYGTVGLWGYAAVARDEVVTLRDSRDKLVGYFAATQNPITLALADADRGIFHSASFVRRAGGSFLDAAVDSILAALEELRKRQELSGAPG